VVSNLWARGPRRTRPSVQLFVRIRTLSPVAGRLQATKAWVLVSLIFVGSLVLALVVPAAALWAVSMLGRGRMESVYIGLLACPVAVIAWAGVLGRLNVAYKQTTGRRDDGVLAASLTIAVLAAVVLLVLLLVFAGTPDPANHGPWPA
jgi:hypothetical protein